MRSRKFSTPCREREPRPGEPPSSAVSWAAIYGRAAKRIAPTQSANSAIRTFLEPMVPMGESSQPKLRWRTALSRPGHPAVVVRLSCSYLRPSRSHLGESIEVNVLSNLFLSESYIYLPSFQPNHGSAERAGSRLSKL